MKKCIVSVFVALFLVSSCLFVSDAYALGKGVVFVDTNRLMLESKPGKMAQKHVDEAKAILQNALDKVITINEDKKKSLKGEAAKNFNPQAEIQQAQALLQRQFEAFMNEVRNRMLALISQASEKWLKRNNDYMGVVPNTNAFATNKKADVTGKIMDYLDDLKIELPELPKVVVENNDKKKK